LLFEEDLVAASDPLFHLRRSKDKALELTIGRSFALVLIAIAFLLGGIFSGQGSIPEAVLRTLTSLKW
jgi:hypothetical protein